MVWMHLEQFVSAVFTSSHTSHTRPLFTCNIHTPTLVHTSISMHHAAITCVTSTVCTCSCDNHTHILVHTHQSHNTHTHTAAGCNALLMMSTSEWKMERQFTSIASIHPSWWRTTITLIRLYLEILMTPSFLPERHLLREDSPSCSADALLRTLSCYRDT